MRTRRRLRPYSILFYSILYLFSLFVSCDGIGASVNSDGGLYGGTSGDSGSGGIAGSGRMEAGGNTFTVEDLISLSNAGNTEAIIELLSGSGENEAVGTFMVILSGSDIGLPAGGSVTLSITGDGYNYDGLAQDAGDGIVSFAVPRIAVGTTVTVTLEVKAADGSIAATGTATQRVTEGGCDFSIALVDTAPAPVPEGFVLVGDLYVCIHEVTQGEYEAYCGYGGSSIPSPTYGMGPDYPAYYVSWYDALVYCNKRSMAENLTPCYTINGSTDPAVWGSVPSSNNATWNNAICSPTADGYRLPTETEWEQAANDGHTYSGSETVGDVAWYADNSGTGGGSYLSGGRPHEVKTKAPNSLGLYDMSGNVWEWCWDIYSSPNRVIRGGGWDRSASDCAVSSRGEGDPRNRNSYDGFRVVRKAD